MLHFRNTVVVSFDGNPGLHLAFPFLFSLFRFPSSGCICGLESKGCATLEKCIDLNWSTTAPESSYFKLTTASSSRSLISWSAAVQPHCLAARACANIIRRHPCFGEHFL